MKKRLNISRFAEELVHTFPYIMRLSARIMSRNSDALTQGRITLPQFFVLHLLKSKNNFKMKDIAAQLRISLPAVTGLINRMVKMKLVKRIYDKSDRRVIYIEITPEGGKTAETVLKSRKEVIENIFGDLSGKERQSYLSIIRKVKDNLEAKIEKC